MIDFHTFENVHLEDVAEYGRAKKVTFIPLAPLRYKYQQPVVRLVT